MCFQTFRAYSLGMIISIKICTIVNVLFRRYHNTFTMVVYVVVGKSIYQFNLNSARIVSNLSCGVFGKMMVICLRPGAYSSRYASSSSMIHVSTSGFRRGYRCILPLGLGRLYQSRHVADITIWCSAFDIV